MSSQIARNCLSCLAFLVLGALPVPVLAGEPDDLAAPIPITAPWHTPQVYRAEVPAPRAADSWILFTNFDGGKMNWCGWGNDSPQDNCSQIMQDTVLPFSGDAARRAAVVQVLREDFKDFNILVTDIRPQTGDYDMEMIGDWDPAPGGGFAGVAPSIDCFNGNGGEVSFTLDYTGSPTGIAKAVLQEAAHTWGLEHVDSKDDLLYPTTESVMNPTFVDDCFQIVQLDNGNNPVPDNAICKSQHSQYCTSDHQNSYQELLQIFGAHIPDLTAPTLEITAPLEGAVVEPAFELVLKAVDNQSPQVLDLQIGLEGPISFTTDPSLYASPADLSFPIKGLEPGDYTLTATVKDEDANLTMASVHFTVGAPAPSTTSGATGPTTDAPTTSEGGTEGTGDATGDGGGSSDASASDGGQTGGDDQGCNCASTGAPPSLALLALLGLVRARRRPRA